MVYMPMNRDIATYSYTSQLRNYLILHWKMRAMYMQQHAESVTRERDVQVRDNKVLVQDKKRLAHQLLQQQEALNAAGKVIITYQAEIQALQAKVAALTFAPGYGSLNELFPELIARSLESEERRKTIDGAAFDRAERAYVSSRAKAPYETVGSEGYLTDFHWLF